MNQIPLPDDPPLAAALRACAAGFYPAEAAAELLIAHASWLCGSVRHLRPHLFAASDRTPISGEVVFVSSDRTRAICRCRPLTSADALPLLGANDVGPVSAVTSREQRPSPQVHERGPNWRTNAVRCREQNQLCRDDFRDACVDTATSISDGTTLMATIDWPAAIDALNAGGLPSSGGERRVLRLAASLADGIPVDLRDAFTGMDTDNVDRAVRAMLHASGRRPEEWPGVVKPGNSARSE